MTHEALTQPLFTKAAETSTLERMLRDAAEGELVTYDEMSAAIYRDVRTQCRSHLKTARHTLQKEGIYFEAKPGEGLGRLKDSGKVDGAHSKVRRAGRRLREGLTQLQSVDFRNLTNEEKTRALTLGAQLQTAELFASSKAMRRIETAAEKSSAQLTIGQTMELFSK